MGAGSERAELQRGSVPEICIEVLLSLWPKTKLLQVSGATLMGWAGTASKESNQGAVRVTSPRVQRRPGVIQIPPRWRADHVEHVGLPSEILGDHALEEGLS